MALALEFAGLRDSASAITARAAVGHAPPLATSVLSETVTGGAVCMYFVI
jgi:hypothetical protein